MVSPRLLGYCQTADKVENLVIEQENHQKKSWHKKRREEILRLREEVKKLLLVLKHQKTAFNFGSFPHSSKVSIMSRWEDLAMREVVALQKSTQENERLKELVHYHELRIKSIERASELLISYPINLHCSGLRPHFLNRTVFDNLITGMDEMYVNIDDFFTKVKMHELPRPGRRNDSVQFRVRNVYVELLDCYAVPFDLRKTENAVWILRSTRAGESNVVFDSEYFDAGENTRMKCVCVNVTRHGIEMRVIVHVAVRRYSEQERTIF